MKINSKQLTGVAAAIEQSQSNLTETEIAAAALLERIWQAKDAHTELLHKLELRNTERETLVIELTACPQELANLDNLIANCQTDIEAAHECIESLKREATVLRDTLEHEQATRRTEATNANRQLTHDVLHSDEVRKAWSVIEAYWDLTGGNQLLNELYNQLKTIDKEHVPMPELATYRGSQVLETLSGLR